MALIVNGERIEEAAIAAETARVEQARQANPAAAGLAGAGRPARQQAVETLADQALVRQQARKTVTLGEAEVEAEFARLVESCGGIEAFRAGYRVGEADQPRFKRHLAEGMRIERLLEQSGRLTPPSEIELSQYYASHVDQFMAPPQVRASHIVRNPCQGDPEEAYRQMCEARRELLAGAEFATVAGNYSECASEPGGDLGFFAKGQMVEAFEAVVFSMQVGEVSPVFMTQFGFHVAKVTDRRETRRQAFDEVRGQIAARLGDERREQALRALAAQLRPAADIREVPEQKPASPPPGKPGKAGKPGKQGRHRGQGE